MRCRANRLEPDRSEARHGEDRHPEGDRRRPPSSTSVGSSSEVELGQHHRRARRRCRTPARVRARAAWGSAGRSSAWRTKTTSMLAASVCASRPGALERGPADERTPPCEDVLDPLAVVGRARPSHRRRPRRRCCASASAGPSTPPSTEPVLHPRSRRAIRTGVPTIRARALGVGRNASPTRVSTDSSSDPYRHEPDRPTGGNGGAFGLMWVREQSRTLRLTQRSTSWPSERHQCPNPSSSSSHPRRPRRIAEVPRQRLRRARLGGPCRRPPVEGSEHRRRQRVQADLRADRARQDGRQGPPGGAEGRLASSISRPTKTARAKPSRGTCSST